MLRIRAPRSVQLRRGALRVECTLRGWSYSDLALAADVNTLTVRRADWGKGVDRRTLGALMRALEANPVPRSASLLLEKSDFASALEAAERSGSKEEPADGRT